MQDSRNDELAVVFVDLAGFTALTETHGDVEAADLVERFVGIVTDSLGAGDRIIKSIGDAVMLTSPTVSAAVRLVRAIVERCDAARQFPAARAGLHFGPVVRRGDDVFGSTVNLAARVAAQAVAHQTLATSVIASAAVSHGIAATSIGTVMLRNIGEPVELFELDTCVSDGDVTDPVCRMQVQPSAAAGQLQYDGISYWFCSLECAGRFAAAPQRYIRP